MAVNSSHPLTLHSSMIVDSLGRGATTADALTPPSVRNVILIVLDHVVGPAPVAEEAALNDLHDKICSLSLGHVGAEPVLQELDCLATEAGQTRVQHEGDQRDDRIHVGPHSQVATDTHLHEPLEGRGLHLAPHDHHHLICQLYVWFPAKVATR